MNKLKEKQIYKWLVQQATPGRKWLNLTAGAGILSGILVIIQAWLLAGIISNIVVNQPALKDILIPVILLGAVMILKAVALWLKAVYGFRAGKCVRQHLRQSILDRVSLQGPASVDLSPSGQWVLLLQERVEQTQEFYSLYLPQMKMISVLPLLIMVIAFIQNWATGLIFLITAPLVPLFMIFVGNKAAESNRKNFQLLARLSHHFLDRLQGLPALRLLNRSRMEKKTVEKAADGFRIQTMRVLRLAFLSSAVLEFFSSVSIALTAVYLGMSYLGYLTFGTWNAPVSLFTGFFLLLLAPEFYQPLKDLGTHYHARAQAIGAAGPIMEYLENAEYSPSSGNTLLQNTSRFSLKCSQITVKSPEGTVLLDNISFTLNAGEKIFLVGASGAGKSTLLKTLLGFYPYEGTIEINGQELKTLDRKQYQKNIAWLSQDAHLVYGTLDDNVGLGMKEINEDSLTRALDQAYVSEFMDRLPQGRNTLLGENGCRVSAGQARRIALSRSILRKGFLVLLDEPTANLDQFSEQRINEQLEKYMEKRTVIMATHRLGQLHQDDRILLLDQGKVSASGTLKQLSLTSTLFQQFWQEWKDPDCPDKTADTLAAPSKGNDK